MNVWRRMAEMTKAKLNDMMDRAEDPVTMLNYYMRNLDADIDRAEAAAARQAAAATRLKERHEDALMVAAKAEMQAQEALKAGRDADAKQATLSRIYYEEKAVEYAEQFTLEKARADELLIRLAELKETKRQMIAKHGDLAARAAHAASVKRLSGGASAAQAGFRRMEEKLAAEADAAPNAGGDTGFAPGKTSPADALEEALRQLGARLKGTSARSGEKVAAAN
ncbi:PspA/IM30 family protein [Paenibacillus hamazuiensis]|uniref:PspA/IM30 family protein n=1 Tax=Paenibacillus hamazuiensis TaxID=2936508 RepID=UPI00200C068A|nr:PspA/IM30 family protein [Paenibacillus hamazuiensis]